MHLRTVVPTDYRIARNSRADGFVRSRCRKATTCQQRNVAVDRSARPSMEELNRSGNITDQVIMVTSVPSDGKFHLIENSGEL